MWNVKTMMLGELAVICIIILLNYLVWFLHRDWEILNEENHGYFQS